MQLGASLGKSKRGWHGVLGPPLSYKLKLIAEKIDRPEDRDLKLRIQTPVGRWPGELAGNCAKNKDFPGAWVRQSSNPASLAQQTY